MESVDARKRLGELLDRVARGEIIEITSHGRPVARLVPASAPAHDPALVDRAVEGLKNFHEGKPRVTREELLSSIHARY